MTNTKNKTKVEFDILEKTVKDPIILEFKDEILALVDAFGNSGQSGGSAPFTAAAISQAVKKLCLQQPICDITGIEQEWFEYDDGHFQNKRLTSVFKESKSGKPYYLDAIVFRGNNDVSFTSNGSVKLKDGSVIKSRQFIKLPFKPKTFYIDVNETEWADKNETEKKPGGGWWTSVVKDESQLIKVFEYYNKG